MFYSIFCKPKTAVQNKAYFFKKIIFGNIIKEIRIFVQKHLTPFRRYEAETNKQNTQPEVGRPGLYFPPFIIF